MARDFSRTRRVSEQIKRLLAVMIRDEIKDPRIGLVTISDVEVSRDFAHARVYYTVLGQDKEQAESTTKVLNGAAGYLRRELGRELTLRMIPALHFFYDETQERALHISALIDRVVHKPDSESDDQGDDKSSDKSDDE